MQDAGIGIVLTTAPDEETAARLARGLLAGQLAACVQVLSGVRSFYVWKGDLQEEAEWLVVVKTAPHRLPAVEAWIEENHPYDLPECVVLRGEASTRYAAWVEDSV